MDQVTLPRVTVQQALEALEGCVKALDALHAPGDSIYTRASDSADRAEIALRAALEQPEQAEPVAWLESPYGSIRMNTSMRFQFPPQSLKWKIPLYTHPPRREPLTVTELQQEPGSVCARCGGWVCDPVFPQPDQEPVAWIDDSEHPKHRLYRQSATERRLYGPLRPLYAALPTTTTQPEPK